MTLPAIRQRPDQIAELTRGLHLPMATIHPVHLEVIAESLMRAFADVRLRWPVEVATGTEAEVTGFIESSMNSMLSDGLNPILTTLVTCVVRGRESHSFDGSHLEKRPDLSIFLTGRQQRFPLIVEAKIIDAAHSKTTKLYGDKGIRRFIDGEYAWGCAEAFMIAYVRDGSTIGTGLTPFLTTAMSATPPRYLVHTLPVARILKGADLSTSHHGRSFHYLGSTPPRSPGRIELWHLWLS